MGCGPIAGRLGYYHLPRQAQTTVGRKVNTQNPRGVTRERRHSSSRRCSDIVQDKTLIIGSAEKQLYVWEC